MTKQASAQGNTVSTRWLKRRLGEVETAPHRGRLCVSKVSLLPARTPTAPGYIRSIFNCRHFQPQFWGPRVHCGLFYLCLISLFCLPEACIFLMFVCVHFILIYQVYFSVFKICFLTLFHCLLPSFIEVGCMHVLFCFVFLPILDFFNWVFVVNNTILKKKTHNICIVPTIFQALNSISYMLTNLILIKTIRCKYHCHSYFPGE